MRLGGERRSDNVEDRRGIRVSGRAVGVGGGIGTILLVIAALYLGIDPRMFLGGGASEEQASEQVSNEPRPAEENRMADFVSAVLASTEDTWKEQFRRGGKTYHEPKLVLFTDMVQSACGYAQAAVGPFYCPEDQKLYIDLGFFREMKDRFQAGGDFAQAYVIAHEVGHHVQNLLGIMEKAQEARARSGETQANRISVRLELQADCFAGVWAHHAERARNILEEGDVEEGLKAASAIGDDRMQRRAGGYVVPDSFTHGSSAQRVNWFRTGIETGDVNRCNTFRPQEP
ncbi:MAG: putative neutral zinc metallopeptidase [Deltaproteobacteria bacterium]|nr:putative neutral zinc metallopeptidase [Deltaproteobacteria bacterium]